MDNLDIHWILLALAYTMLLIPLFVLSWFKTGLGLSSIWAALRMTLQLLFVGFYLEFIFELDNPWVNLAWLGIMIGVAGFAIIRRSEVMSKYFLLPVFAGLFGGMLFTLFFMLVIVLQLDNPFTARFLIPLAGMILGNCLNTSIIGIRTWHHSLTTDRILYYWYLTCGATQIESLKPFVQKSLQEAFSPSIATMATIGLIALPGMMTGQILGGSSPATAIKYQILIMIAIFTATVITVTTTILISRFFFFDLYGLPKGHPKINKTDSN